MSLRELELYRQDPAREARLRISDYVVCRVCGAMPKFHMSGKKGHLWAHHKMATQKYHRAYPGARLCSFNVSAWSAIGRPGRCSDVGKLMAMFAESYVPPAELELYRQDPAREARLKISDYVVCRVCGAKIRTTLSGSPHDHLLAKHGLNLAQYRTLWPGAPRASVACATAISKASIRWAKNHPDEVKGHQARYWKKPEAQKKRRTNSLKYSRELRAFAKIGRQAGPKPKKRTGERGPVKEKLFQEASELYHRLPPGPLRSWGNVARTLTPADYAKNPKAASDKLRLGARYHESKTSTT